MSSQKQRERDGWSEREGVMEEDEKQSLHAKARKKEKEQEKKEGDTYE